ncbi:MAG: sodium:solute symporter [Flavobacteriales bacterium]|jgi:Na+/proline symporter|nr:sodium:solute symporter [Flavobacteriales bacterium]
MSSFLIVSVIAVYFLVLIGIAHFTSKGATNNASFFLGERKSPWYIVAFGMIGASLSGVTFLSVPGWVGNETNQFSYMQAVFGFFFGYLVVALVLLPLYYRMNLTSIYGYLEQRFGFWSYKTGAFFFLISRLIGASVRLLLVANVLQKILFDAWNIPFVITVIIAVLLIWVYTNRGGIKTIIWTDTLQTAFMLGSVLLTIYMLSDLLKVSETGGLVKTIQDSPYSKLFFFEDINSSNHFLKHFIGGMFITIGMTGLDQDMMQKNLSCKNTKEAQKNMLSMASVLIIVNLVFLSLGALLFLYSSKTGIGAKVDSDMLFSEIALHSNTGTTIGILFLLGVIAAAYSSADSALTSLTTSFSVDFLDIEKKQPALAEKTRKNVHIIMSAVIVLVVILLKYSTEDAAISLLMKLAGFTYGPLIGLFFFGILTKRQLKDNFVPIVSILVPAIIALFWYYSTGAPGVPKGELGIFGAYKFGFEIIIYNALLAFIGLFFISSKTK